MAKNWVHRETAIVLLLLAVAALLLYIAFLPPVPCAGCNAKVEVVASPDAQDEVISFIRSAKESIDVEIYVFTSEDIIRELGEAEKRGVRVRVIMEPRIEDSRKEKNFNILRELGAEVKWASFEYKLTHTKMIIVDGKKALVGSINLSESALNYNREVSVILEGEAVKELVSLFEVDWQKAGSSLSEE